MTRAVPTKPYSQRVAHGAPRGLRASRHDTSQDEEISEEIEDNYAARIATVAGGTMRRQVDVVVVLQ